MKQLYVLILLILFPSVIFSQIGGSGLFPVLNYAFGEFSASAAGRAIAQNRLTASASWHNPAANDSMINHSLSISYADYYGGLKSFSAHFSQHIARGFDLGFHAVRFGYGDFQGADENGILTDKFQANDNILGATIAYDLIDSILKIGLGTKFILSNYEQYHSSAFVGSLGIYFKSKDKLWTSGLVLRDLGAQFTSFGSQNEAINWAIDLSASKKLAHAPFIFTFSLNDLQSFELKQDFSQKKTHLRNSVNINKSEWYSEILMHTSYGVEFIPSRYFSLMAGYNSRIRQELLEENYGGMSGFALGLNFGTDRMRFAFQNSFYHKAAGIQSFNLSVKF